MAYQKGVTTAQASVDAYASCLDMSVRDGVGPIAITLLELNVNAVTWIVYGANLADYSDAIVVNAEAAVAKAGADSYVADSAHYQYYRAMVKSTVSSTHGAVNCTGFVKN